MNAREARETIAAYLTGRRVSPDDLEQACMMIQKDAGFVEFLMNETGREPGQGSECRQSVLHLAEFSGLTASEQKEEMPEISDHLVKCEPCRGLLKEISAGQDQVWDVVSETAGRIVHKLSEAIRLAFDDAGRIVNAGLACVSESLTPRPVAAFMAGDQEDESSRDKGPALEWKIEDAESKETFILRATQEEPGLLRLMCEARPGPACRLETNRLVMAVYRAEKKTPEKRISFARGRAPVLRLHEGKWELRLEYGTPPEYVWIIPLEFPGK